ncbi:MAG: hypothetical protein SGBAC_001036 [Bacillariaceae sp.]
MRSYPAEMATFGYALSYRFVYQAKLMSPPGNDTQLCTFPSHLLNQPVDAWSSQKRIALLVSLGGCDTATKVEIALEMHKTLSNLFRFVVFYNNDPKNQAEIPSIVGPFNTTFQEDLQEMSFTVVSTSVGQEILARIQQHATISGNTPDVLGPESDGWNLQVFVETFEASDIGYRTKTDRSNYVNFSWYRVVLFCLLVTSPIIRATFLWWTGGGRIRMRRNDRGRIIGLLYTPPMSNWFVSHGTQDPEPVADTMTSEQVMALPEIIYKPPADEAIDKADTSEHELATSPDESSPSEDKDDNRFFKIANRASKSFSSAHPLEHTADGIELTTTCTTCSICIEDLEPGECLRLLPCGHAFHTDCIMPWLTRRQGCCPLCKASVLGEDKKSAKVDGESEEPQAAMDLSQDSSILNVSGVDGEEEPIDIEAPSETVDNHAMQNEDAERTRPESLASSFNSKGVQRVDDNEDER